MLNALPVHRSGLRRQENFPLGSTRPWIKNTNHASANRSAKPRSFTIFGPACSKIKQIIAKRAPPSYGAHRIDGSESKVTAKAQMAWGTFNSGLSIGLVDVNLAHAMSHPLSGHFGLHHGLAVALCTVQSIRFNREAVGHKYAEVGRLISNRVRSDEAEIDLLIDKILQWFDLFKIKPALKDYDVPESALQTLTRDALQIGAIRTNPKPVEETQLLELFYKIWHGETS